MIHWIPQHSRGRKARTRTIHRRAERFADFQILPSSKELNLLSLLLQSRPLDVLPAVRLRVPRGRSIDGHEPINKTI